MPLNWTIHRRFTNHRRGRTWVLRECGIERAASSYWANLMWLATGQECYRPAGISLTPLVWI